MMRRGVLMQLLGWWLGLLRSGLLIMLYGTTVSLALIFVMVWTLLT